MGGWVERAEGDHYREFGGGCVFRVFVLCLIISLAFVLVRGTTIADFSDVFSVLCTTLSLTFFCRLYLRSAPFRSLSASFWRALGIILGTFGSISPNSGPEGVRMRAQRVQNRKKLETHGSFPVSVVTPKRRFRDDVRNLTSTLRQNRPKIEFGSVRGRMSGLR